MRICPSFTLNSPVLSMIPQIKVEPGNSWRPAAPPSRLDTEMFRALEATERRLYPGAITVPGMVTGATDLAELRAKGVQCYGIGPQFDEAEFAEHGWHSDVERLSENSLYGLVQFVWHSVYGITSSPRPPAGVTFQHHVMTTAQPDPVRHVEPPVTQLTNPVLAFGRDLLRPVRPRDHRPQGGNGLAVLVMLSIDPDSPETAP